ncbi:MAG TPA: hypothetical protein VF834_06565 [Streptosporangiaceae bacterium]
MVEMLCVSLGVLVVASFATIAVYVLVGAAVMAWTLLGTSRRDQPADELDRVLAEILGWPMPERLAEPRRSRLAWHR